MAAILMGSELGAGLGHVARLLPVARALQDQGHTPVFVVRDLQVAGPLAAEEGFSVLQAPVWRSPPPLSQSNPFSRANSGGYSDLLAKNGFNDREGLAVMVDAWSRLIDLIEPSLVVADYSPTLCLAAFESIPTVVLGNGYTLPPTDYPRFPRLLPDVPPIQREDVMLGYVQEIQKSRGRAAPERLTDLLGRSPRFVCTLPEVDAYGAVRREPLSWPLHRLPRFEPLPSKPSYFAYLDVGTERIEDIALGFAAMQDIEGHVFIRGAPTTLRRHLRSANLTVYETPPPLDELLPRVSLTIHRASNGLAEASLAGGRQQLVLPDDLEKNLIADKLVALKVAHQFRPKQPLKDIDRKSVV